MRNIWRSVTLYEFSPILAKQCENSSSSIEKFSKVKYLLPKTAGTSKTKVFCVQGTTLRTASVSKTTVRPFIFHCIGTALKLCLTQVSSAFVYHHLSSKLLHTHVLSYNVRSFPVVVDPTVFHLKCPRRVRKSSNYMLYCTRGDSAGETDSNRTRCT